MKPEPSPRIGTTRGWIWKPGPPKRLKNSLNGLSGPNCSSKPVVLVVPTVVMLTTAGPTRSTSAVKSGRRAAAVGATGATTAGGLTAAFATPNTWGSIRLNPAPSARPKPAATSATVSCFIFIVNLLVVGGTPLKAGSAASTLGAGA